MLYDTFPSALPGGNPKDMHNKSAIVDCIWIKNRQVYYILDVLYWGILPFTNCEVTCIDILFIYFRTLCQLY